MKLGNKQSSVLFYTIWIISLLVQAAFTELLADEAYYWKYAQQLAWGYFDHPPMVAIFIKIGYALFQNELGVRLLFVATSALTIWVWQQIIKPKNLVLFYLLVSSIAILHAVGFIATTDGPFLLFASLFFWIYKQYLQHDSAKNVILLSLTLACMLLTKYHGVIIIGLVVLSNLNLLKRRTFWLTFLSVCLLLSPHIIWQINNGYPSIKYHLFERSQTPYHIGFTLEYISVQLIVLGPLVGLLFFYLFQKHKANTLFEKTLKWCFWGGYLFFLLMSFKGKTEAYWTLFIVIPALAFTYQYIEQSTQLTNLVKRQFYWVMALIIVARIFLIFNFLPFNNFTYNLINKYHYKQVKATVIADASKDLPVAFMNSYQKASLFEFYTGVPSFSLNNIQGRKNQYDLWQSEEQFRGEEIAVVTNYKVNHFPTIATPIDTLYYTTINNFQNYSSVTVTSVTPITPAQPNDTLTLQLMVKQPINTTIDFDANPAYPSVLYYQLFKGKTTVVEKPLLKLENSMLDNLINVKLAAPNSTGKYNLCFSIKTGWLPHTINSKSYNLLVE